jgi:hypothetical protein
MVKALLILVIIILLRALYMVYIVLKPKSILVDGKLYCYRNLFGIIVEIYEHSFPYKKIGETYSIGTNEESIRRFLNTAL